MVQTHMRHRTSVSSDSSPEGAGMKEQDAPRLYTSKSEITKYISLLCSASSLPTMLSRLCSASVTVEFLECRTP
eukprot:3694664-Karenia_brevis.AAC.1